MKPSRFSAFRCRALGALVLSLGTINSWAIDISWNGTGANSADWGTASNWTPGQVPTANDRVLFSLASVILPQTINLNADRSVLGLASITNGTNAVTLLGGGTNRVLSIGASGINHTRGALNIGSGTAGQNVDVRLMASQTWNSSTAQPSAGTIVAIVANNTVSNGSGAPITLDLGGLNTGSTINGLISDGTAPLSLKKTGTTGSVWTLNLGSTHTGSTSIESGTLRFYRTSTINPGTLSMLSGTTLHVRGGGTTGFTGDQMTGILGGLDAVRGPANSTIIIETNGGNITATPNITGNFNINKTSGNELVLGGTTTSTGTITVGGGSIAFLSPSAVPAATVARPKPIVVADNASVTAVMGGTGFNAENFLTLRDLSQFGTNATFGMSTANGDFTYDGPLLGTQRFVKSGDNILTLTGNNLDTGGVTVLGGSLRVRDMQSGGVPSPIGASSAATGLTFQGGRLIYDGPAAETDRLFTYSAGFTLESSGTGPIGFTNLGSHVSTGTAGRTITLTGYNQGDNRILGSLQNTTAITGITKRGGGSWRISNPTAAAAFTGAVRNDSGNLIFDYTAGDVMNSTSVTLNGGKTTFRAGSVNSETVANFALHSTQSMGTHLKLENGFALTVGALKLGNQVQRNDLIDLSGNPANSLTINAIDSPWAQINGILMTNGATSAGRASVVLRAQDGSYGFPSLSGGSSGTVGKAGGLVELNPGSLTMNNLTTNYLLKKEGAYNATANLRFSTIQLDNTAGNISLNLGTHEISATGFGKGFLFNGPNTTTISGAFGNNDVGTDSAQWFHNYIDESGSLLMSAGFGGSQSTFVGGPGLTVYSGTGFNANFIVTGGIFRATQPQRLLQPPNDNGTDTGPSMKITNGAVFEVGAAITNDVVSTPLPSFTKPVGAATGAVRFMGDSGVSAFSTSPGGKQIIAFSDEVPPDFWAGTLEPSYKLQNLTWGVGYFLTVAENESVDGDYAFKLSTSRSNATVEVRNPIAFNNKPRVFEVANGSAAIDAQLTGALTGAGASGLVKAGPGTLQLGGVNTYKGETRIMQGVLKIDTASLDPASSLWIDSEGILEISEALPAGTQIPVNGVVINGVAQPYGIINHPQVIGTNVKIFNNSQTALGPYDQWVLDNSLASGVSGAEDDADRDGTRNLLEYATGANPNTFTGALLKATPANPRVLNFNRATGRTDIIFTVESSTTLTGTWTTIATSSAGEAFTSSATGVVVADAAGAVTITDNRTPVEPKTFYRLRAVK